MNQPYSQSFVPAAAVIEIRLAAPGTSQTAGPFPALIDTGADTSVVPKSVLLMLGAPSMFEAHLRSPWGEVHAVVMHLADVLIGSDRFPTIELAANESDDEFVLGRNVLNKLPLFLDGPQQVTQLLSEPTLQRLRAARADL